MSWLKVRSHFFQGLRGHGRDCVEPIEFRSGKQRLSLQAFAVINERTGRFVSANTGSGSQAAESFPQRIQCDGRDGHPYQACDYSRVIVETTG